MNAERNTTEFTRQTVCNFRFLDAQAMGALRTDLGLALSDAALYHCREHFRLQEGRDPTVRELLFINSYARAQKRLPDAAAVMNLSGSDEDVRVFADMQKKQAALRKENASCGNTLCEWAELAGRYLSRSGLPPYYTDLVGGHVNEIAARTAGEVAANGDLPAAAMLSPVARTPHARNIVLLTPTGNAPFTEEIARFMQLYGRMGVEFLAAPCGEGMLHHLLALGNGLMLDSSTLPDCHAPDVDPSALLSVGNGALLLLATDEAMPVLFSCGLPVISVGTLQPGDHLFLRHGNEITLSLSLSLLAFLRHVTTVDLSLPVRVPTATAPTVLVQGERLLGQVTAQGGCEAALLGLIGTLRKQGGDPRRTTLTAVWEAPPHRPGYAALSEAMLSVLDHHRICTELAIPSHNHRQLMQYGLTAPRVTFFAIAESGAPTDEAFSALWQDACKARNFRALRKLFYSTN